MKIQKINQLVIQKLFDDLAFIHGFKRKSCNMVKTILNGTFKIALTEGVIKEIPVKEDLELPKKHVKEMNVWNEKQIETFLSFGIDIKKRGKYYVAVLMGLFTGMRKGEILGLTWDNVDLENNIIYVKQILESNGREIVQRTKTGQFRQIVIDEILKEELIRHKEFQKKDSPKTPFNLVFCTRTGKTVIENTLNDILNKYCDQLNLPRIRVHDTRHTNATLSIYLGANVKQVQERLGHTRASMTLDTYSHFFPNQQHFIVDKMNRTFKRDLNVTKLS